MRLFAERPGLKKVRLSRVKINHHMTAHERKPKGFKENHPGHCIGVDMMNYNAIS